VHPVSTPAIVLSAIRYGDSSKIVKLATRLHGVHSVIAKGALRPRSRFGASLQVLSGGVAQYLAKEHRELHTLTAFDVGRLRVGLAAHLPRWAAASVLAELMLRFAPAVEHAESFAALDEGLDLLEAVPDDAVELAGLRAVWRLVGALGYAPALEACARCGSPVPPGELPFGTREGGALCPGCALGVQVTRLPAEGRAELVALVDAQAVPPVLDLPHERAHRRLLGRYIHAHLAEGAELPALAFWLARPWEPA